MNYEIADSSHRPSSIVYAVRIYIPAHSIIPSTLTFHVSRLTPLCPHHRNPHIIPLGPANKLGAIVIQHIMLWNYIDEVPPEERARIEAELEALPSRVPSLRSVRWSPVVGGRNQAFSHCFVMYFEDMEGLAEYATHPRHIQFAAPFKAACAEQVVVDFEVTGE
jgi:hypothetical protein